MKEHEPHIRRCIRLSIQAKEKGNHPFGALLLHKGTILLEDENDTTTGKNPLGHAEIKLVAEAARRFDDALLRDAILYSSAEPCVMCAGAIGNTSIRHVVYGCSGESLRRYYPDAPSIPCRDIFATAGMSIQVDGPILEDEALKVFERSQP